MSAARIKHDEHCMGQWYRDCDGRIWVVRESKCTIDHSDGLSAMRDCCVTLIRRVGLDDDGEALFDRTIRSGRELAAWQHLPSRPHGDWS